MAVDNWVERALTDATMVVELLLRLKQSSLESSSHSWFPAKPPMPLLPPLGWGKRQPRSKPRSTKERELTMCSPTTPLSWSAASLSDGYDDSIAGKSKGTFANESTTATATANKKSRKNKTFTELKEKEGFLLKERIHLKRELASLRVTLNEQRSRGDNLKRIKLDLQVQSPNKMLATSDEHWAAMSNQCYQTESSTVDQAHLILPRHDKNNDPASSDSCRVQKNFESQERCFIIPDLNMLPSEEDPGCEILYGMS